MELAHIHLQYDRLKRHHQLALAGGDEIAFLDLAHALRIWVELKASVSAVAKAHGIFLGLPHHTPPKFIKRSLQGATHISMPLASGVESPGVQIQGVRSVRPWRRASGRVCARPRRQRWWEARCP